MAIHPIEYRYGTEEMKHVWSEENRLVCIMKAEAALAKAEADVGLIPEDAAKIIEQSIENVELKRVKEIEDEIHHDMMAVVLAISEKCEEDASKWVHFGATSNDMLDTATGLQMKDAIEVMEPKIRQLLEVLLRQAEKHKETVCAGRTHGQIGVPTTYGLRFAIWAAEIGRHIERLEQLKPRVEVGQMTGAVGTQAAFGEKGIEIQKKAMEYLGITGVDVSNQIIQRDRHAEFVMWMANVVTTLDKIGVELRTLQRSELAEVEESFGKKQVGSSTMPHKRNPIKSEQICGLARIVRSMIEPELMNNTLWDERDLTNSSCERVVFPETCVLTDHILKLGIHVTDNLHFYPENIKRNLELLKGLNMGEAVMIELAKRGVGRQEAHEIVRTAAMQAHESGKHLRETLLANKDVSGYLNGEDVEKLVDPYRYTGTAVKQVEITVEKLRKQYL
ncbi:MAG: adenylosuccinate lyase [Methanohalophilus sp. T328-1]|jgi:adenylosuccinate lyase|uniref:Adenylosuccinate lyase n=1 Tax=Methanohalophilus euhalobius TaxID=51203 RepID=A0A285FWE3_9EURY|nr:MULTISPECIES: adenylosuccinate lyase [Methanohalophilus]KXS41668.1 MAG: adenylosuccinate lyase [Methanohalophilus sp. T328-1]RSD35690.1 MAG: adenylosuccinate lyase [Methanohalophilus sp.]OBZ35151.1 MAG: adenylosuccinate lyase [Methanohalophilus sp. DAL1]ODV49817.1 MAG: adenylosuccinate lyase [Methanohalophilus sp. 2-GBenrich]RXG34250.1 adenylosuccinate lyase [Methanohalophilus sp. WG1-DM]